MKNIEHFVIAHRGASVYAPENTLAAFQKAAELGLNWVEFDVQLTRCGKAVVIHDDTLARTTNGYGWVAELTYAQLAHLDAGSWFAKEFKDERIPTLENLIPLLVKWHLSPVIEIKPNRENEQAVVANVLKLLTQWPKDLPFLVSSFSPIVLNLLREKEALLPLALGIDGWYPEWENYVKDLQLHSVHVNYRILDAERVQTALNVGCKLFSYTVNQPELAKQLFNWGVTAVFSDNADKIISAMDYR